MFKPQEIRPIRRYLIDVLYENLHSVMIYKDNTLVVSKLNDPWYYNTLAVVNNVDEDGTITRSDRPIWYDRVDLGELLEDVGQQVTVDGKTYLALTSAQVDTIDLNPTLDTIIEVLNTEYLFDVDATDFEGHPEDEDGLYLKAAPESLSITGELMLPISTMNVVVHNYDVTSDNTYVGAAVTNLQSGKVTCKYQFHRRSNTTCDIEYGLGLIMAALDNTELREVTLRIDDDSLDHPFMELTFFKSLTPGHITLGIQSANEEYRTEDYSIDQLNGLAVSLSEYQVEVTSMSESPLHLLEPLTTGDNLIRYTTTLTVTPSREITLPNFTMNNRYNYPV